MKTSDPAGTSQPASSTDSRKLMTSSHALTRREFGLLATLGLSSGLPLTALASDAGVDVDWRSSNPFLSGNFLPVKKETQAAPLKVSYGKIPKQLDGTYLRNGPNPLFEPLAYTYPLDGDGMIHAVRLQDGQASYRNRFVQTSALALERRAGRAVYGSVVRPAPVPPELLLPTDSRFLKNGACINVIRHGDHLLALGEANTVYELNQDLDTLGLWKAGRAEPIRMGAHNRRHPQTGDLYAMEYSVREPIVKFHRINPSGLLLSTSSVTLPVPMMIHDFVLTERHIVLVAGPAVFDFEAAQNKRTSPLQWRPELGTRIAAIPLDGEPPIWFQTDAFFVYHFANAFERRGKIVVDYVMHDKFTLQSENRANFTRLTLDLARRAVAIERVSDEQTEFPRINHLREALPTRYSYMPVKTASLKVPGAPSAVFNCVVRHDSDSGNATRFDAGNMILGEAAFVPRPGATREDDGYLATFAYDPIRESSAFMLIHAARLAEGPVVVVDLPQRVPQGLHGNWVTRI